MCQTLRSPQSLDLKIRTHMKTCSFTDCFHQRKENESLSKHQLIDYHTKNTALTHNELKVFYDLRMDKHQSTAYNTYDTMC